nr:translesion error-prone DNA polymerase V autoproteolytic subunit [Methylomonas sp. EFPC1]
MFKPAAPLSRVALPLFISKIPAGFPSPASDYIEKDLDLNELMIENPAATFFARAQGYSMINAGILPGDILVINRALDPQPGSIVVCVLDNEFTVKRLVYDNGQWQLHAENPEYPAIELNEDSEMQVWGVVTYAIHSVN